MTGELETAIRDFLKPLLREVVEDVLDERRYTLTQPSAITSEDERLLLRAREAARRLAISDRHLHKLTVEGVLPCVRAGRLVRYSVETIERWIRETESTDPPARRQKRWDTKASSQNSQPSATRQEGKKASKDTPTSRSTQKKASRRRTTSRRQVREKAARSEEPERLDPFRALLSEIGIDRGGLGPLTNGELRQIAEVDIPVFHGWMHLGREMPEEALERLRQHFRKVVSEDGDGQV